MNIFNCRLDTAEERTGKQKDRSETQARVRRIWL